MKLWVLRGSAFALSMGLALWSLIFNTYALLMPVIIALLAGVALTILDTRSTSRSVR